MTIRQFMIHTTAKDHRDILEALLSSAFENDEGQLELDREVDGGDLVEEFCHQINRKASRISC